MKFIKNIQRADETVRKRWLIIFSAAAILLAVGFWLIRLNAIVAAIAPPAGGRIAERESGPLPALRVGLSATGEKAATGLANSYVFFKDKVANQNKFTVSRANQNFIWDDLEKLPERELP